MIPLLFIGDGPRDAVSLPRLVEGILGVSVKEETENWKDLHLSGGKGFSRKLRYAVRQAKDRGLVGVVAAVDTDRDRDGLRLRELHDARTEDRSKSLPTPTALGQANPHGEAWLLDDPVAVREAFGLPNSVAIPNWRRVASPKNEIETIKKTSERSGDAIVEILADIAGRVSFERMAHAKDTGFDAFQKEVREELGHLATPFGGVSE